MQWREKKQQKKSNRRREENIMDILKIRDLKRKILINSHLCV